MDNYVQEKIRIGDLINSMMEQGYKQSHLMSVICSTSLDKCDLLTGSEMTSTEDVGGCYLESYLKRSFF